MRFNLTAVLLAIAFVCFVLRVIGVSTNVDLIAAGLALVVLAQLLGAVGVL